MAINRKPPHPARGLITILILLLVLVGAVVAISRSADEVPTRPIETDVSRDQPS
jgi:hypothetical protein